MRLLSLFLMGLRVVTSAALTPHVAQAIQAADHDNSAFEKDMYGQPTGALQYGGVNLVADHEWLEVMRFGSKCRDGEFMEGYSIGFPGDCGSEYHKINRSDLAPCSGHYRKGGGRAGKTAAKVGYGCWFYFAQPQLQSYAFGMVFPVNRSSGISVNVGRSLRASSRADVSAHLGLPCANPPMCDAPYTVQDKLWCERAVELGYDSIQVARPHKQCEKCVGTAPGYYSYQELTLCTGKCMSEEQADACASGVEMRTASGAPCSCSNEAHSLNCGAGSMLYGRPDDGKQTCRTDSPHHQPFSSPELGELYAQNLDNADYVLERTRTLRTLSFASSW